jgi:acetyl esterase/lipase
MTVIAYGLALLASGLNALLFFRVRSLTGVVLWFPKMLAGSAAAFVAAMGALATVFGFLSRARLAIVAGVLGALPALRYVLRVAAPHAGFERAFGPDWQRQIALEQQAHMLQRRWVGRLPSHQGVRWERDVSFWTIPGADRELLCDLWQPPEGVNPSGLAFIYLHGGAWHWTDKDFNTRSFFRHLAAQGHVVMDVAYRMCPEVDIYGMVGDVKRAIAWLKANADVYGVDPARVVVAGGSSGGHLALLAAYAPDHAGLTPEDVKDAGADTSVRAVVAAYAGTDMRAFYRHFDATFGSLVQGFEPGESSTLFRILGTVTEWVMGSSAEELEVPDFSIDWMMGNLLGGSPEEVPEVYELASPITHVGSGSPPTLLLQGEHDCFQPAQLSRALHHKLVASGVPSVYVEFPQTEHGFDLLLPRYAPAAQAALYDLERFLALMAQ